MKEITFINRNKDRWKSFEKNIKSPTSINPDDLADQFIQLTDDLSYAKTFFPKSPTISYLNSLTIQTHQQVYKNKKEKSNRFSSFWKKELPLELYHARKYFYISIIIFLISFALGAVSAIHDDGFIRLVTSDEYVNTTLDNIEKGDPMGIYNSAGEFEMFFRITFNNIKVSFIAFIFGILTPIAVGFILFYNGVMLGSFQTFFYLKNLFAISTLTIYIHGALEIPAIVLAGGAGIILGNSYLFPGTYPRMVSLQKGVKRGLKIMLALVPVFIVAGFLESFVTRHYETMPTILNLAIILCSLSFIVWYFFIYPIVVYKKHNIITDSKE
ncbi:stage II sporulation protein M [Plebeiibacterium sediminum]|uniref:Stage II sporulation protein M n=1 Tax=Plebeiibacterium sediminum TaxID=2992112 RepID=A0AAE3M162_9BACT|nr:stage II sporulation protein M [Plebeiobacterium sediminum]MCW3784971.1 stage II sporulation protein M [Plebeiobacterium sediminum]